MTEDQRKIQTPTTSQMTQFRADQAAHDARPGTRPNFRPQSAGKRLTGNSRAFEKMSDREKTEAYLNLYEQNLQLTQNYNELQQRVKSLTIQLTRLASEVKNDRSEEVTRDHIEKIGRDYNLAIDGKQAIKVTKSVSETVADDCPVTP